MIECHVKVDQVERGDGVEFLIDRSSEGTPGVELKETLSHLSKRSSWDLIYLMYLSYLNLHVLKLSLFSHLPVEELWLQGDILRLCNPVSSCCPSGHLHLPLC